MLKTTIFRPVCVCPSELNGCNRFRKTVSCFTTLIQWPNDLNPHKMYRPKIHKICQKFDEKIELIHHFVWKYTVTGHWVFVYRTWRKNIHRCLHIIIPNWIYIHDINHFRLFHSPKYRHIWINNAIIRAGTCVDVRSNQCLYFDYWSNERPPPAAATTSKVAQKEVAQTKINDGSLLLLKLNN